MSAEIVHAGGRAYPRTDRARWTGAMFGSFLQPQFMPCPECGASVPTAEMDTHECSEQRRLDYQLFQLRAELASFDVQLAAFLASPRGRFEAYYAERDRLRLAA